MSKKIKQWIDNHRQELCLWAVFTGIIAIVYSFFCMNHYATDTYYLEAHGYLNNAMDPFFKDGRLMETLFLIVMKILHVPFYGMKIISWLWGVVSLSTACYLMYTILHKFIKKTWINYILSFGIVVNIFVLEYFMFPELTGDMCFGIFMTVSASVLLIKHFESKNWKYVLGAIICACISSICYQGVLSLLVLIPIIFTKKYSHNIKEFIQKNLWIALVYGSGAFCTLIISKVNGASRLIETPNYLETLKKIIDSSKNLLINTGNFLPKYSYLILILTAFACVLIRCFQSKNKCQNIFFFIYVMGALLIVPVVPHMLLHESLVWLVPRSMLGYGLIIPFLFLFSVLYFPSQKWNEVMIYTVMIILFVLQYHGILVMAKSRMITNAMDMTEAKTIANIVYQYEQENQIQVTKIVEYHDQMVRYGYENTTLSGDVVMRTMTSSWASQDMLELVLKRSFSQGEEDLKLKKECESKNEDYFDSSQIQIKDDILHICVY